MHCEEYLDIYIDGLTHVHCNIYKNSMSLKPLK